MCISVAIRFHTEFFFEHKTFFLLRCGKMIIIFSFFFLNFTSQRMRIADATRGIVSRSTLFVFIDTSCGHAAYA